MESESEKLTSSPADKLKYEIFQFDEKFDLWQLKINGAQADCPYQSVAVFMDRAGGFITIKQPCTTTCPLARIFKDPNGGLHYELSCGAQQKNIAVTEIQKPLIQRVEGLLKPV